MFGKRLIEYVIAFMALIILNFVMPRLMPGDPIDAIYGNELVALTPELREQLRAQYLLDQSIWSQFLHYLYSIASGDLGYSYAGKAPVIDIVAGALPWTILLVGTALFGAITIALFLGIESGWRRGERLDRYLFAIFSIINGIPGFFIGMILIIIFALNLKVLPAGGAITHYAGYTGSEYAIDVARHLILPATALCVSELSWIYLLMRGGIISVINEPFIKTGMLKGLDDRTIRYRYAARNALLPVFTRIGIQISQIVAGILIIEAVFTYPGIGYLLHDALLTRDLPLIQGILLIVTISVLAINFTMDILYPRIDPRIRHV
ncbi:MAG: ABC transporter permease [Methanosarcinales archaeon]|nr:ABC transporter permease [Methanosarcinales archaeon]